MEKYGFVYLWYNSFRKRFYVGCHWGREDDGYICSSKAMWKSYLRNPSYFKRRILARVYDRTKLLEEEYRWLSMIKDEELGVRYYNLNKHHFGHWTATNNAKTIGEKISENVKIAYQRPEVRTAYEEGMRFRNNRSHESEVREKRRQTMINTMAKKYPLESRPGFGSRKFNSEEYKLNMAASVSASWKHRDAKVIGEKISVSLASSKVKRSEYMKSLRWYNDGIRDIRRDTHPGEGWNEGRIKR